MSALLPLHFITTSSRDYWLYCNGIT